MNRIFLLASLLFLGSCNKELNECKDRRKYLEYELQLANTTISNMEEDMMNLNSKISGLEEELMKHKKEN